jgi:small subunit ribosomal protein S1
MAWRRIKHPSEVVEVGQELKVKVLKFDRERNRVSLGLKQLGTDPWQDVLNNYPKGTNVKARVTNLTDYGCFAEIADGIEGLVHVSEMDHTNKNIHPSKVVQIGDEIMVQILDIDEDRRRISLGIKQTMPNPWEEFDKNHQKGDKVSGTIKSITDFGIFIGLEGGIDGLVHLSDLSWTESGEEAIRNYNKGDTVEAVILSVDAEANRISLGIKQLNSDPFNEYLVSNDRGAVVKGVVPDVDAKGARVQLADDVEGYLRASEIQQDKVDDATTVLNVGDEVEAKIVSVDRKTRGINLSVRAKDEAEQRDAIKALSSNAAADTQPKTIGDLIKEQQQNQ